MALEAIPDDVKRFILVSVHSVPYLEAILLLHVNADRSWDAKELGQRLYVSEKMANELLTELQAAGILEIAVQESLAYRYHPASESLRDMIDRLAHVYVTNLVDVSNLIHSKTGKKAQRFADAFIWRKDS